MLKIGIIPNKAKDKKFFLTKQIISKIVELKGQPVLTSYIAKLCDLNSVGLNKDKFFKKVDYIIVLGGDGTILQVSKSAAKYKKPILGINLGAVGYLADVEKKDIFTSIEKLFIGDFKTEKRMMIQTYLVDSEGNQLNKGKIALNDICLLKSTNKMISVKVTVNNEFIDMYRCDGLIIATPTGSTAYSLSAGGSILKPDSQMIAITPICPQMIYSRPSVIPSSDVIKLEMPNISNNAAEISLDGRRSIPFDANYSIIIKKSSFYTSIIKTSGFSFYDILRKKMFKI